MSDEDNNVSTKGLDALLKALKNPPTIRVGILGNEPRTISGPKSGSVPTNAEVGAMHEFGTTKMPQRSFLKMPLTLMLDKKLEEAGLTDQDNINELLRTSSLMKISRKIAVIAESIVREAFQTGGYGNWIPSNMERKKVQLTLVETQQLRDSITSEVE